MSDARITLAMIVRDEEELLPRFLGQASGLYDELVVVDTGSTDQSVELLTAAGARVLHRPWTGDFSAARNAGLEAVRTGWVVFLDADEMASPELVSQVRRTAEDESAGAASLVMKNPLPHGHRRESRLLRMFRNDPTIRFRHAIHEDISEGVAAYLGATGRRLVQLSASVEHLGYVRERARAKDKKARDVALLQATLEKNPDDLYSHLKLLEQARFWSDAALWRASAEAADRALGRAGPAVLCPAPWGGELVALVSEGLFASGGAEAIAYLDRHQPALPSGAFLVRRGVLHEENGQSALARKDYEQSLQLGGAPGNLQLTTVRPLLGLARLELAAGKLAEAAALAERALAHNPQDPEALLAGAAISRARGGAVALEQWRHDRLAQAGESPELHGALGECALLSGQTAQAVAELRLAAGSPPRGPSALRLAQALLANGEAQASLELAAQLQPEQPAAGLGVLVCTLAQGRDVELTLELEPASADAALRSWVDALWLGPSPALAEGFRKNAAAVAEAFPWLVGYVESRARPVSSQAAGIAGRVIP